MSGDLKKQIELSVDASGVETGVNKAKRSLNDLGAAAAQSGKQASDGIANIGQGGDASAKKVDAATKSMIQSIQRTTAVMEAGSRTSSKYFETLASQRGIDVNALKPYLEQLDAVSTKQKLAEQAMNATNPAMQKLGVSAAQTAAALRQVPAQFTDIITALQAGQQPLTVILQQGGQLKDAFGGIGPAAKALATYVAGLINPITLAAAAGATLAAAYHQGSKEADAYSKALILTGNAAGTTAGQLADMAQRISKNVGTKGGAAEALAELAGTGNIAANNLEKFAQVAIQMERTVGKSVGETAKDLAELGKSPVEASEKLNEKYHYLTASVYEQIKALQDQGKTEEAAAVAQKAYADAFDRRTTQIVANLGLMERGWISIKDVAKGAWDAMLNVGRKETSTDQLAKIGDAIETARKRIDDLKKYGGTIGAAPSQIAAEERRLKILLDEQSILQENVRFERRAGEAAAASVQQAEARIKWDKEGDQYLTRRAQMEREIAATREKGQAAGVSSDDIEQRIAEVKKKYADLLNTGIEALEQKQKLEKEILAGSLATIESQHKQQLISEENYVLAKRDIQLKDLDGEAELLKKKAELAGGKKDLAERTKYLGELAVLEQRRKNIIQAANNEIGEFNAASIKSISEQIRKWADATKSEQDLLQDETEMFGESAEARKILSEQIKVEAAVRQFLADEQKKNHQLLPDEVAALYLAADARKTYIAAFMGEQQARAGIKQLQQENKRFAAESIVDEQDRAAALLEVDADLWRERIRLAGDGTEAQKRLQEQFDQWYANRQMAPVLDRWKNIISNLDNDFREGFRNMLLNGQDAWKSFSQSLGNTLKTALADAIYQTFIKKYVVQIVANLAGVISGPAIASALSGGSAGGQGSGLFSTANLLSAGKTIYSGFSGGFSSAISSGIASLGSMMGSSTLSSFAAGMKGASLASGLAGPTTAGASGATGMGASFGGGGATVAGWIMAGMIADNLLYDKGFKPNWSSIDSVPGKIISAPDMLINKSLQSLGIGEKAASILSGSSISQYLFGRSVPKITNSGIEGTVTSSEFKDSRNFADITEEGGLFAGDDNYSKYSALDKDTQAMLSEAFAASYKGFDELGKVIGAGSDLIKDFTYNFKVSLNGLNDEDAKKRVAAALAGTSDAMASAFVDKFRTSIQVAVTRKADNGFWFANDITEMQTRVQQRPSSRLDPYIDDIIGAFDKFKASLAGVKDAQGKLAVFTASLFELGESFVRTQGFAARFGEALDFKKLEAAATGGETVLDTFARLTTVFDATNLVAVTLGQNIQNAFGAVGLASTEARQRLIDAAGGIDSLTSGTAAFAKDFLTEAQQMAPTIKSVHDRMAELGHASVDTKEEFAALVQGLDLGTEAGAKLYAQLIAVAPAFAQVADYSQKLADQAIENAKRQAQQQADAALGSVNSAFSGLQRSVDAERKKATDAYNDAISRINQNINTVNGSISKLASLSSTLRSTVDRMRLPSQLGADRAEAQAQIAAAIAIARAGGALPNVESLSRSLDVLSQPSEQLFQTFVDYQRDFLKASGSISDLADLSDAQKSIQESTLESLQDQLKTTEDGFKAETDRLDNILASAQEQIDALNGIDNSVMSVADAIKLLTDSLAAARLNPIVGATSQIADAYKSSLGRTAQEPELSFWKDQIASGRTTDDVLNSINTSREAQIVDLYRSLLGREPDAAGLQWQYNSGLSVEQLRTNFMNSDEYLKKLRGFAVGTNYVPYDMPAMIHEGERIIPAADNQVLIAALRNPSAGTAEMVAELRTLRAENNEMKKSLEDCLYAIAKNTQASADILDASSNGGRPLQTVAA